MSNFQQFGADFQKKAEQLHKAIGANIPIAVGEMLVDGFKESFDLQRFNDYGSEPWKQVKRRIPGNEWYGFRYIRGGGPNYAVPPGARGFNSGGSARRFGTRGGKTNFTPAATTRSILLGDGSVNLRDSIYLHTAKRGLIVVATDQPHAQVHNEGLRAKIFGRKSFHMPKRQFMGNSDVLNKKAKRIIENVITRIV